MLPWAFIVLCIKLNKGKTEWKYCWKCAVCSHSSCSSIAQLLWQSWWQNSAIRHKKSNSVIMALNWPWRTYRGLKGLLIDTNYQLQRLLPLKCDYQLHILGKRKTMCQREMLQILNTSKKNCVSCRSGPKWDVSSACWINCLSGLALVALMLIVAVHSGKTVRMPINQQWLVPIKTHSVFSEAIFMQKKQSICLSGSLVDRYPRCIWEKPRTKRSEAKLRN